jgi:SAM-dependent methyltransferase
VEDHHFISVITDRERRVSEYKEMVSAYYLRVTDHYRQCWGDSFHLPAFTGRMTREAAIASIEEQFAREGIFSPRAEVLDVGCGVGGPTLRLAALKDASFIGVNVSHYQVEIARQLAQQRQLDARVSFEVGDAMCLRFEAGRFDAVVVFEAGCHAPHKAMFYRECARVLKPGGRFVGVDWMGAADLAKTDRDRYIEPICQLHALTDLISVGDFRTCLAEVGIAVESIADLTPQTGLMDVPTGPIPIDWGGVFARGVPGVGDLLKLGGIALAVAAQAGAFVLCRWVGRRE